MAVFTEISRDRLERFLSDYALGAVQAFSPIAEGTENTNYRLDTGAGRFVLTVFEKRTPEEALPFVVALMRHLAAGGQPVPQPIADREGVVLKRLAGKPALIVEFLPGRAVEPPEPRHCRKAGEALARLHLAAQSFAKRRENPFGQASWRKMAKNCEVAGGEARLLGAIEEALEEVERGWPHALPRGACHTDLFPDNVFFEDEKVSGLIDFYFACDELLAYDLAVCLVSWCFDAENRYSEDRGNEMIAGYETARALSSEERRALPLLCMGAAVRFTLTRLYDSLHPQPGALVVEKDPAEFAARIQHFRQQASART